MIDAIPQFEVEDLTGTTDHFNGTVGTSAVNIPSIAGGVITEILIENLPSNSANKKLLISFDGGTNFKTLGGPGTSFIWSPKGYLTQIKLKSNLASTDYEIVLNREAT